MKKIHIVKKMITEARQKARLTQQAMAEKLGMSQPAYAYYETGTRSISENKLRVIAHHLDLPIEHLLTAASTNQTVSVKPSKKKPRGSATPTIDKPKNTKPARKRKAPNAIPPGLMKQLQGINTSLNRIADILAPEETTRL